MYILGGHCGYCKRECSRSSREEDSHKPTLITPELPFVREIVCEPCWEKLKSKLTKMVDDLMESK